MKEIDFGNRLATLRKAKKINAYTMSIDLGQHNGYISSIETGRSLPSMFAFFNICEYLKVSPSEFFDYNVGSPNELNESYKNLHDLNENDRKAISQILKSLNKHT